MPLKRYDPVESSQYQWNAYRSRAWTMRAPQKYVELVRETVSLMYI